MDIRPPWVFVVEDTEPDQQLSRIVSDLQAVHQDLDALLLATRLPEGIRLIKSLRDAGINTPVIAPQAFA